MRSTFQKIYNENIWGSEISRSGTGSGLEQTAQVRAELPKLLKDIGARTMLDIPCGDFYWMQHVDLPIDYIGADIVPDLIAGNNNRYGSSNREFRVLDASSDPLPQVDVIFCRDMLVHFSPRAIKKTILNMKASGSTWLLTTTFTDRDKNRKIATGQWHAVNLQLPPYRLPTPERVLNEGCTEMGDMFKDKSLGLWRLSDLTVKLKSGNPDASGDSVR